MSRGRRRQAPLTDPTTDPRAWVTLTVAAAYLGYGNPRTLIARVDAGLIACDRDGKLYKFAPLELLAYKTRRRMGIAA